MPKITYIERKFSAATLGIIGQAETICDEYQDQGFSLTLRQLYYQFVSRGLIPNKDTEYKRLGSIINDARLAGLIDWEHIEDRTRHLRKNSHWRSPGDIMESVASGYAIDKWKSQGYRCEVWIEKDALIGVIEEVCEREDVPYFSCRGYTSQSEVWGAGRRLIGNAEAGQDMVILHLGDHDPSGIDMSRDIAERLAMFTKGKIRPGEDRDTWIIAQVGRSTRQVEIRRVALNMPQVEEYDPPPNPAKITDSRCEGYQERFGDKSWELDALPPNVIADIIRGHIVDARDAKRWRQAKDSEQEAKRLLKQASTRWDEIATYLQRTAAAGEDE